MDRRNRKYYLVRLPYYHNTCVKKLKEIKTVKLQILMILIKIGSMDTQTV